MIGSALLLAACLPLFAAADDVDVRRQGYLDQLKRVLPESKPWSEWIERSGELPPDFAGMPSLPNLPDPLIVREGYPDAHPVTTTAEWEQHRTEVLNDLHHWILGAVPPAPDSVAATVLNEKHEQGATVREVDLRFGPDNKAKLWLEVMIPDGPGPYPVFMSQENHRGWATIALRRGYIACIYAGADSKDDTDTFAEAYPEYDWSRLMRRAWAAGRCIDYLQTLPEVNKAQIAITGHSRNGKQSLMAAAIDQRIALVISSSSGAGGVLPTRHYSEQHLGEGIENITRAFPEWFHPRWRFFVGHEDKLPVDLHSLVAMAAPRPCLLSIAINDSVESTWAMEQTYHSVKPVYALYNETDKLRILYRPASHETWPTTIERYIDFCDLHFGRGHVEFPETLIHPYDWNAWAAASTNFTAPVVSTDSATFRDDLATSVNTMLGAMPPTVSTPVATYGEDPDHIESLLNRGNPGDGIVKKDLVFGDYINADVYLPATAAEGTRLPLVLWLHPLSPSKGYVAAYKRGDQFFQTLPRAGFAVFCYDQIGHGRRIEEVEDFYTKYPNWSILGHMVRDARAALDAIATLDYVDQDRILVVGYGPGALVGMHLGALDDRPDGYALIAGPQPWRSPQPHALNLDYWSKTSMLWPQLGRFAGVEATAPYDVPDLLAALAPKPTLVLTPQLDWQANAKDVEAAVDTARAAYAALRAADALQHLMPDDYNNLATPMQERVVAWLKTAAAAQP